MPANEAKEIEKAKVHIIVEIIEYMPNAVVSRTIIKKTTGNVTVSSFAAGEELAEKTSPFDNYIQIIDGAAEITIDDRKFKLKLGQGIIIPAHSKHCFNAGAKDVYVFDHTCDNWINCYKNSGIEKSAKDAGAKVVPANSESYYQDVSIPGGKILQKAKIHQIILETDVFINVPVLKDHSSTKMTGCLKNMMGSVWDRGFWHKNNLNQCIADYASYTKKPALNIIDCYNVMTKNGPQGVSKEDVVNMQSMIITTDWVAGDAAAAKMLRIDPNDIAYIPLAHNMGLGNMNLESLNIKRIKM